MPLVIAHPQAVSTRAKPETSSSNRIQRLERNPVRKAALELARKRLGNWLVDEAPHGTALTALRLQTGMSQRNVAEKMKTQQSNVSRFENNPGDPQLSTLESYADALGVELGKVVTAVSAMKTAKA